MCWLSYQDHIGQDPPPGIFEGMVCHFNVFEGMVCHGVAVAQSRHLRRRKVHCLGRRREICEQVSWKVLVHWLGAVAHLAWKTGVCRGRAAFNITFQHKTTLSVKTRNRTMNFAMLSKYYIGKIPTIHNISPIFAHKSRCPSFLHGVFGNPSCYFVHD